jgi:hypothetical protein
MFSRSGRKSIMAACIEACTDVMQMRMDDVESPDALVGWRCEWICGRWFALLQRMQLHAGAGMHSGAGSGGGTPDAMGCCSLSFPQAESSM